MVFRQNIKPFDFVSLTIKENNVFLTIPLDTGLSEMIVPLTRTDIFNRSLEIQQSVFSPLNPNAFFPNHLVDLLASYEVTTQINAIEELIAQGAEMQIVLRLLCLASLTAGGIKTKNLESIKREILQVCPLFPSELLS